VEVGHVGLAAGLVGAGGVEEGELDAAIAGARLAEPRRGVALGIDVDEQARVVGECHARRHVHGGSGLPDAALLIGDGEDAHGRSDEVGERWRIATGTAKHGEADNVPHYIGARRSAQHKNASSQAVALSELHVDFRAAWQVAP